MTRRVRARGTDVDLAARAIGGEADPFMDREVEQREAARGIDVEPPVAKAAPRAIVDGIGDDVEAGLAKQRHRARHVPGRGDEQPGLRRLGMNEVAGEAGVLVGVARALLQRDARRIDAERGQQRAASRASLEFASQDELLPPV